MNVFLCAEGQLLNLEFTKFSVRQNEAKIEVNQPIVSCILEIPLMLSMSDSLTFTYAMKSPRLAAEGCDLSFEAIQFSAESAPWADKLGNNVRKGHAINQAA